jgi:hypothetical protein
MPSLRRQLGDQLPHRLPTEQETSCLSLPSPNAKSTWH